MRHFTLPRPVWVPGAAICLLLAWAVPGLAGEDLRIAVLPFEGLEVAAEVAETATAALEAALVRAGGYVVLDQGESARLLEAQGVSPRDCTEVDCAARIGRLLGAEQVVIGTVAAVGNRLIVSTKIVDVAASRVVAADSVSAPGIAELEAVCLELADALSAAAAARVAAAPRGAEQEGTGANRGLPVQPPHPPQVPAKEPQSPGRENEGRLVGGPGALAFLGLPGAILLADLGNVARSLGFERQLAGTQEDYDRYLVSRFAAYGFWAIGGGVSATGYFRVPPERYSVSRWGRVSYHAGLSLIALGGVASMMADNLWYGGSDGAYVASRVSSYSLWALGGLGVAGSFLVPGEKQPLAPRRLDQALLAGGTAAIVLGGFTQSFAQSLRIRVEAAESTYLNAPVGSDFDALYGEYTRLYGWYAANSVVSYVLWGGGAAAVLSSLFLRPAAAGTGGGDGRGAERKRPAQLMVVPTVNGVYVGIGLKQGGGVR